MIAVIIGEILYDLRSALDHIAVSMAPNSRKSKAGYPVEVTDPFAKDDDGAFIYDEERRRSFTSKIKGMPADAVAMIMHGQPYTRQYSELETLALLNRLENADKHRELVTLGAGIMDIRTIVPLPRPLSSSGPMDSAKTVQKSPSSSSLSPQRRQRVKYR